MEVFMKKILMTSVMLMTLNMFGAISSNFTISSNYFWRGMTQTMDNLAYSGGFDYAHASGFYVGTWGSNVSFGGAGLELDTYAGYSGETEAGFGYDVGYISYAYPDAGGDFEEYYLSGSYEGVGVSYYQPSEGDADYMELSYSYEDFSVSYGDYEGYGSNVLLSYSFTLADFDGSVGYSSFSHEDGGAMTEDEDGLFLTLGSTF